VTELMAVPVEAGGVLAVEVDPRGAAPVKAGRTGQAVRQAALASVVSAVAALLAKLGKVKPSQIRVAFGISIRLTAEAGAVVVKTAGERGCVITAHWRQAGADG
jgi:hypothetical protein